MSHIAAAAPAAGAAAAANERIAIDAAPDLLTTQIRNPNWREHTGRANSSVYQPQHVVISEYFTEKQRVMSLRIIWTIVWHNNGGRYLSSLVRFRLHSAKPTLLVLFH